MKNDRNTHIFNYILLSLFIILMFMFFYKVITIPNQCDYNYHIYYFYSPVYIDDDFYTKNNLFRYLLNICHYFNFDLTISSSFILTFFTGVRLFFYYYCLSNVKSIFRSVFAIFLCVFISLYNFPLQAFYLGNFVGNIWHSPTFISMLAFVPFCVYYFNKCFIENDLSLKNCILFSFFMTLCCVGKPNFVIAFIPVCAIWILIDFIISKDRALFIRRLSKGILVSIPTFVFLLILFLGEYTGAGTDSIVIRPLFVWKIFSKRLLFVFLGIVLSLGIGITIYIFSKNWFNKFHIFLLLLLVVGALYFAIFAEGVRAGAGNFIWTYASCGLMFNTFLLIEFFNKKISIINKYIYYLIYLLFIIQSISGIYYLLKLYNGGLIV